MGGSTRVTWRGHTFDRRTRDMLVEVQRLVADEGIELIPVQGSYSSGKNSAGTHEGGGAVDLRTWHLKTWQKDLLVRVLRQVGFAAWYRYPPKFDEHIHGIAIGCPDLSFEAKDQVKDYRRDLDGLAGDGPDRGPDVPDTTWEDYLAARDAANPEDELEMTEAQIEAAFRTSFFRLMDEVANRSTPTGRQLGDDLNLIIGGNVRVALHAILDEAANRSTPTGRQVADDIAAVVGEQAAPGIVAALQKALAG